MIKKEAIVTEISKDFAWVETMPESACGSCESKDGCTEKANQKPFKARVYNRVKAKVGDRVVLTVDPGSLLLGSLLVYIVPLVLMLVFALISNSIINAFEMTSTFPTVLSALAGLFCGLWIVRRVSSSLKNDPRFSPQIEEILTRGSY